MNHHNFSILLMINYHCVIGSNFVTLLRNKPAFHCALVYCEYKFMTLPFITTAQSHLPVVKLNVKTESKLATCEYDLQEVMNLYLYECSGMHRYIPPVFVSEGEMSWVGRMSALLPPAVGVLRVEPSWHSLSRCCSWTQRETSTSGVSTNILLEGLLKNIFILRRAQK